jgi:hypothetical protein
VLVVVVVVVVLVVLVVVVSREARVFGESCGESRWRMALRAALLIACAASSLASQQGVLPGPGHHSDSLAGVLMGGLTDSVHHRPLANAVVALAGTPRRATSGSDGTFRFDSLPAGSYTLVVSHPLLDTLGLDFTSRPIAVGTQREVRVELSTPSRAAIRDALCPRADPARAPGLILGRVRDADSDAPLVAASVSLAYSELRVSPATGVSRTWHVRKAAVTAGGRYVICGLPGRVRGTLQAARGADATAEIPVALDDDTLLLRSMTIGSAVAAGDSTASSRSAAVLEGTVVGLDGQPVAGAEATVDGSPAAASTSAHGDFALRPLPSGTHELVVRKVGYDSVTVPVELTRREPRSVLVRLTARAPALATVHVSAATGSGLKRAGFDDRRAMGLGYFVTPAMIDSLRPRALSDLLGTAPGLQVTTTDWGTEVQSTRSTALMKDACVNVFVDRTPWSSSMAGDLDTAFPVADVMAVEVYGGGTVPSEFTVPGKSCATVVVWTRTNIGKP